MMELVPFQEQTWTGILSWDQSGLDLDFGLRASRIMKDKHQLFNLGLPRGSGVKNPPASTGDTGSIPGLEDPLEKEMVTCCSIPAWEIPCTEGPGELQSTGLQKL